MTLEDIKALPVLQTRGIAAAEATDDGQTHNYIVDCLLRLYAGDYGIIPAEDTEANNAELAEGCGRIVARYEKRNALTEDIYIISAFDIEMPDVIDANHTMIMLCSEY